MSKNPTPTLTQLEHAIEQNQYEEACRFLMDILYQLDRDFGNLTHIDYPYPTQLENQDQARHEYFCTRMASAIEKLFTNPNWSLSIEGFQQFMVVQRWIGLIFASSPYLNADHILQTYNIAPNPEKPFDIELDDKLSSLMKFCILYLPESNIHLNLDTLWQYQSYVCANLCIALQSPRFLGTQTAYQKRAGILQWLPEHLLQMNDLDGLPSNILHDAYMHCSYDTAPNKHQIKQALNHLIRQHLLKLNWQDRNTQSIAHTQNKPVMLVLLEHFNAAHSIYRTHSSSLKAAKELFYLVGVGHSSIDETGRAVFDEFHELSTNTVIENLNFVKNICEQHQAAVLYMPSIGMDLLTIFASNTRLAPIQVIALGHPATTHSQFIDYVVVEDDYVGNEACFSEILLRLPKDALPYVPSALVPENITPRLRQQPEVVNIGIAATTMKLNPYFLEACRAIRDFAKVKVHFHFALGQSQGITHPYVAKFIHSYLGHDATAHPHLPYHDYLNLLNQCDMMLNPFPFGNTNGIIDMVTLGLVGVCKTGDEVHEHIDEGLFKRLGLPEWLITRTADEYVACALRLAENHEERLALRKHIIENNRLDTLFTGDPTPMGKVLFGKLQDLNLPISTPSTQTPQTPKLQLEIKQQVIYKKKKTKK